MSNKNKTKSQDAAIAQIVKLLNDNGLTIKVEPKYEVIIVPVDTSTKEEK